MVKNDWVGLLTALSGPIGMLITWLLSRHKSRREEWQKLYHQAAVDRDNFHDKWLAAEKQVDTLKRQNEKLRNKR